MVLQEDELTVNIVRAIGMTVFCALVMGALIGQAPDAWAGIGNHPLNTDEATVLRQGEWVVATGAVYVRQSNGDNEWSWVTDVEYGLMEQLEVDVEIPYLMVDRRDEGSAGDVDGFGDAAVRVEYSPVREQAWTPAISLAIGIKTQSAEEDNGLGSGEIDYTVTMLTSKTFDKTAVHANVGMTVVGDPPGEDFSDTVNYNLAIAYEANDAVTWVGEILGSTNQDRSAKTHPLELLVGGIYRVRDHVTVDFGIGAGLSSASPDLRLVSGATVEF